MATANLSRKTTASNAAKSSKANAKPNLVELAAFAWAGIAKVCEKEFNREEIGDGQSKHVDLHIAARIDGQVFQQNLSVDLTVGHGSERATSQTPQANVLIGYLLSKMNEATREAVLRDLPEQFDPAAENGYPEFDAAISEASNAMLKKLRAKVRVEVSGSISCQYEHCPPSLGVVAAE